MDIPDNIIQQDILFDDIKSFRRIIQLLLFEANNNYYMNDECKTIVYDFINLNDITPLNYNYEYKGYKYVYNDYEKHKQYITDIMNRLKNAQDTICDGIYNRCYTSRIYQQHYLENFNY